MVNNYPSQNLFPQVICLTLDKERERQLSVVRELENIGIKNYEFFPGYSADSEAVKTAYSEGRVKRYPDCFRCGKRDCGNPDCNNVLLPVQVAVALSYQAIFKQIATGVHPYTLICEDDIVFAKYAKSVLYSEGFSRLLDEIDLAGNEPVLLRMTNPDRDDAEFNQETISLETALQLDNRIVMSNPFFIVNRAFSELAHTRLNTIDHTADVMIHNHLSKSTKAYTLNAKIVIDRSWGLGNAPSLIHPKPYHLRYLKDRYGESSLQYQQENERLKNHRKKAHTRLYGFIGSPRCGSHYLSAFMNKNGLEIGHEALGKDGICAWQYAISSTQYPYIADNLASSDYFLHIDHWYLYTRHPSKAIPSLIIENSKAPLSYAFRRKVINATFGINLDEIADPIERAAQSYIYWYQLALRRDIKAILRVEYLLVDCKTHLANHNFVQVEITNEEAGAGKPYLGVVHSPEPLKTDWMFQTSEKTLGKLAGLCELMGYRLIA